MWRLLGLLLVRHREHRTRPTSSACWLSPALALSRRLPQRSMEAHRKGKESAAAARAAAEAAGEDQVAQEQAAKEAFDREKRPHSGGAGDVQAGVASAVDIEPRTAAAAALCKGLTPDLSRRRRASSR